MTPRDFVYWLQGLFELGNPEKLNKKQIELIKNHLALVLIHESGEPELDDPELEPEEPSDDDVEERLRKALKRTRSWTGPRSQHHCGRHRLVC